MRLSRTTDLTPAQGYIQKMTPRMTGFESFAVNAQNNLHTPTHDLNPEILFTIKGLNAKEESQKKLTIYFNHIWGNGLMYFQNVSSK